jgi:arylsulfatase A
MPFKLNAMTTIKSRFPVLCLILFLIFIFSSGCKKSSENDPPNILIFLADDLGYNDISCYRQAIPGQPEKAPTSLTPNIDHLAEEGMRFTDFYAGAAVCSPSRVALITGRNATRAGIYNWIPADCPMHLRAEEITIAELVKQKGYRTGHFGKWHLTSPGTQQPLPNDQGFDYSFFTFNNAQPSHKDPVNFYRNGKETGPLTGYSCQLVADEAIGWLDSTTTGEDPFYIHVWFNEPHVKLAAPEELTSRHSHNSEYYGAIENMDLAVGKITSFLKNKGLEENTLIIFTSDNGSQVHHSNFPFRGRKAFNYEGGIRVPFIIKWEGRIPPGMVRDVTGSFTDILPSLAEITGSSLPAGRKIDGLSLLPVFMNETKDFVREEPLFFYRYFHDPICMLREGDWVLLGYDEPIPYQEELNTVELAKIKPPPDDPAWSEWGFKENHMNVILDQEPVYFELYNLEDDIQQKKDLATDYPGRVSDMKVRMTGLRQEMISEGGNWYK